MESLKTFLDTAMDCASYTRSRALGQKYDRMPFDLAAYDRSRLVKMILPKQGAVFGKEARQ